MNETKAKTKKNMSMRRIIVTSLIVILSLSGAFMAFRGNLTPSTSKDPTIPTHGNTGMPMVGIAFAAPPFDLEDPSFGVPINVTNIGLFCYYYESTGWNLSLTYTAFQNYTDWSTYVDGYVTVWQDAIGATYVGSDSNVSVSVRVRGDGWIMAWMNQNQDKGNYVYWAESRQGGSNPPANGTTMARAIQRVYAAAAKTFPTAGYGAFSYYDYQYTTATRLAVFGSGTAGNPPYFMGYMTMRNGVNFVRAYWTYGGYAGGSYYWTLQFDGNNVLYSVLSSGYIGRTAIDMQTWAALFTTSVKHSFYGAILTGGLYAYLQSAVLLYLN